MAVPSQWEGTLEDGRALYIRFRHGELTVGAGLDVDDAVRNSAGQSPLHFVELGNGLDGYMTFPELKEALRAVLDFPTDLIVEEERALATMGLRGPDSSAG